jgi:hypothetical protein
MPGEPFHQRRRRVLGTFGGKTVILRRLLLGGSVVFELIAKHGFQDIGPASVGMHYSDRR